MKALTEITEEEFRQKLEESIKVLEKDEQFLYQIYLDYLKDKDKYYLTYFIKDNIISYTKSPRNKIGFKIGENYVESKKKL